MIPYLFGGVVALMKSGSTICWKSAILTKNSMSDALFSWIGSVLPLVIGGCALVAWMTNFQVPYWYYLLVIAAAMCDTVGVFLTQYLYSVEKISTLAPYSQIGTAAMLVASFLVFDDGSWTTLIIALVVVSIVLAGNLDLKTFSLSRYTPIILAQQWTVVSRGLIMVFALKSLSVWTYQLTFSIASLLVLSAIMYVRRESFTAVKTQSTKFWIFALWSSVLWEGSELISFFLVQSLGLVQTTILWFFAFATTIVFAWKFLWEVPSRKSIVIALCAMMGIFIATLVK